MPYHQLKRTFLISLKNASCTMINIGEVNTKAWSNGSWTRKSSLKEPFTITRFRVFLLVDCTNQTNHSVTLSFFQAFSKSTFFLTTRLYCKMEMTSSSKSSHETTQRLIYINLLPDQLLDNSLNFRIWSANFSLPVFPPSITPSFPF